jgi:TonB family protein
LSVTAGIFSCLTIIHFAGNLHKRRIYSGRSRRKVETIVKGLIVVLSLVGAIVASEDKFTPARFTSGGVPALPVLAVGAGQVFVELDVAADGRVRTMSTLRATPPYTELVLNAVRGWRFQPAEELRRNEARPDAPLSRGPVGAKVLVAAVFRAPTINVPTFGVLPQDVAFASADVAFPVTVAEPAHAPFAYDRGVVLLEAQLDPTGRVADVAVLRSAPPYDAVARAVVETWSFRPARVRGTPVSTFVYILLGFPVPVT